MNYIGQLQYNVNIGNNKIGNFELLDNNTKNILDIMKTNVGLSSEQKCYISKLGIQAPPGTQWKFKEESEDTDKFIYIGTTGIYELDNVKLLGLFYIPQEKIESDDTAQYIAYDEGIRLLGETEKVRNAETENIEEIQIDNVQDYIKAQKAFYNKFLLANQYYDKAFKGLYWNAGILDPENIIIDYYLELEDN